jgi:transcriptional regulator with XRE-family HTH domain
MAKKGRDRAARIPGMPLKKLREARHVTQVQLAAALDLAQSHISRIEQRTDHRVSTLHDYVAALGGTLEIRAVFPDGAVRITKLAEAETA